MKKYFLILLTAWVPLIFSAQENSAVLDKITGKLEACKQLLPLEKIYLQSDKDVYAPGEIIWFSGFVFDRNYNLFSGSSSEITAALYDASGNLIIGDKFTVGKGAFQGDLLLGKEIPQGCYYLTVYTPWQDTPDNLFIKPVFIEEFYKSDAKVSLTDPEKIYPAGSKIVVDLQVTDFKGQPADKFMFNYEILHRDQKLSSGKVRSESGKAGIPLVIPAETGKDPLVLVVSHPKNLWMKKWALKTSADDIDIRFYVEGGHLTGTVPQKTGFYATARNGIPIYLEADITDGTGQIISKTKTFRPGFGMFPFKANQGVRSKMTITSDYGKGQSFDLPLTDADARPVLTVSKTDDHFVTADLIAPNTSQQELALTATRGYQLLWAAGVRVSGNSRMKIPVNELGTGVVLLSLFNANGDVQSCRLVYLPEKEQAFLNITDVKDEGGKVRVTIQSVDGNNQPIPANMILSVTDTMRVVASLSPGQETFFPDGELRNSVTGFPHEDNVLKINELDFTMIANELKDFSWEKVLNQPVDTTSVAFLPRGTSGRITDKKGNPVANAKVSILNNRDMKMYDAKADGKGIFRFPYFQPVDIKDLSAMATDENGKGSYQVILDPVFSMIVAEKIKSAHFRFQEESLPGKHTAGYLASNPDLLSEPPVIKSSPDETEEKRPESYKLMLESGSSLLDVIRTIRPYTLMGGQIVFYGTINSINAQSGALIVIDGQRLGTQADVLNNISPYDVETLKVSLDPMDIQRYTGLNNVGLIEITTKRGKMVPASTTGAPRQKEDLYRDGYRIPRNFLTTDALREIRGKDLRTTLYWNPTFETGSTGTTTFSIPLSEIKSGFVISARRINPSGQINLARTIFNVR